MAKAKFDPGKKLRRKAGCWKQLPYFQDLAKHYTTNSEALLVTKVDWYESAISDQAFEGMKEPPAFKTFSDWLLSETRKRGSNGKV